MLRQARQGGDPLRLQVPAAALPAPDPDRRRRRRRRGRRSPPTWRPATSPRAESRGRRSFVAAYRQLAQRSANSVASLGARGPARVRQRCSASAPRRRCAALLALVAAAPRAADAGALEAKLAAAAKKPARSPPTCGSQGDSPSPKAKRPRPRPTRNGSAACSPTARARAARLSRQGAAHPAAAGGREARACGAPARALAARLVAIYESGSPSTASVILASGSYRRADHPDRLPAPDRAVRQRPSPQRVGAGARRGPRRALKRVAALKARVVAYNERLAAAALGNRLGARRSGEAAAAHLHSVAAARAASLATLKANIGELGHSDIQAARSGEPSGEAEGSGRPLARRPLLDPHLHRDVRVRRRLRRRQPLQRRRRRLPDPALDLGTLRRPGASRRTPRRPNRTGSPPKSGPTPARAPGSAAESCLTLASDGRNHRRGE